MQSYKKLRVSIMQALFLWRSVSLFVHLFFLCVFTLKRNNNRKSRFRRSRFQTFSEKACPEFKRSWKVVEFEIWIPGLEISWGLASLGSRPLSSRVAMGKALECVSHGGARWEGSGTQARYLGKCVQVMEKSWNFIFVSHSFRLRGWLACAANFWNSNHAKSHGKVMKFCVHVSVWTLIPPDPPPPPPGTSPLRR